MKNFVERCQSLNIWLDVFQNSGIFRLVNCLRLLSRRPFEEIKFPSRKLESKPNMTKGWFWFNNDQRGNKWFTDRLKIRWKTAHSVFRQMFIDLGKGSKNSKIYLFCHNKGFLGEKIILCYSRPLYLKVTNILFSFF